MAQPCPMTFEITKIKSKKRDGYTENPDSIGHNATILSLSCPESLVSTTAIATISQATEANGDRAKEKCDECCDDTETSYLLTSLEAMNVGEISLQPDGRRELRSCYQVIRVIHMAFHNLTHPGTCQ